MSGSNLVISMLHLSSSFICRGNQGTAIGKKGENYCFCRPMQIALILLTKRRQSGSWCGTVCVSQWGSVCLFRQQRSERRRRPSWVSWWRRPGQSCGLRISSRSPGLRRRSWTFSQDDSQCGGVLPQRSVQWQFQGFVTDSLGDFFVFVFVAKKLRNLL